MKKWMVLFSCLFFTSVVFAQKSAYTTEEEYKVYMQKITNMERIDRPFPFMRDTDIPEERQRDINMLYKAKNMAEQNPSNFNAVLNYALLIGARGDYEIGYYPTATERDEAYKWLERAKKLRPTELIVYQEQERLLDLKCFGDVSVTYPPVTMQDRQDVYKKDNYTARQRLALIEEQFKLEGLTKEEVREKAFEAYLICSVLNRKEDAARWLNKAGGQKRLENEEAYARSVRAQLEYLIQESQKNY